MKDLIAGLALLMVLTIIFSSVNVPEELPGWGLFGDDYPGEYGMVLPGGGAEPAEAVIAEVFSDETRMYSELDASAEEPEASQGIIKEEKDIVNDTLLGFWHGVAAVLIGETAALIVATVCIKLWTRRLIEKAKN